MNVVGPSNSHPRGRRSPEQSNDSSNDDSDRRSDDDSSQTSDDDSNQSTDEEEDGERDREAALEAIKEKLNSCIVVGAKKALNAHQKLARRRTFDLERSEAQGGMIFDYVRYLSLIL